MDSADRHVAQQRKGAGHPKDTHGSHGVRLTQSIESALHHEEIERAWHRQTRTTTQ